MIRFKRPGHPGRRGHGNHADWQRGPADHGEGRRGLFGGRGRHDANDHPGGRRGKRFTSEELRLMVLRLLDDAPQHGYQLIRGFADKSGEGYVPSPGVLYPLLTLLTDMGLIEEIVGEGSASRRCFALTPAGKAALRDQADLADAALGRLTAMAGESGRTDPAPVRRAMMNLRTAAIQRLTKGDADEDIAFRIAELIDEAARRVERLKSGE